MLIQTPAESEKFQMKYAIRTALAIAATATIYACSTPTAAEPKVQEMEQAYPMNWTANPTAGIVLEPVEDMKK